MNNTPTGRHPDEAPTTPGMFTLQVRTTSAAFHDPDTGEWSPSDELVRLLIDVADAVSVGGVVVEDPRAVLDSNGNRFGTARLVPPVVES